MMMPKILMSLVSCCDVIVDTVVVGDVDGDDIIDFESNDFVISVFGDNFAGEDVTKC